MLVTVAAGTIAIASATTSAAPQRRPDFVRDVAPIVYAHCVTCHGPTQIAPFPLLSYDDVRAKGKAIVQVLSSKRMPPWNAAAAPGFPALQHERRLPERQAATLTAWVAAGMPAGDLSRAPLPPTFPMGWPLGLPSLTLTLPRAIFIPPDTADRVFTIAFGLDFPNDRWIQAIDYAPTARAALSHALFFAVPATTAVDNGDVLPGVDGLPGAAPTPSLGERLIDAERTVETLGVWVASSQPGRSPNGAAFRLPKRSNLVMQLHARAADTGAIEDGTVAVYFANAQPASPLMPLQVPPLFGIRAGIDLAPGDARITISDTFVLPVDVTAFGARGHAHDLARELKMTATLPNGSTRGLLWIDRWTVAWQDTYYFTAPVRLPRGTTIRVDLTYDNSAGNPRNRSIPPLRVTWGPALSEEIGSMDLVIAVPNDVDTARLSTARAEHFKRQLARSLAPSR